MRPLRPLPPAAAPPPPPGAAAPVAAATWSAPATVSTPHTFVFGLEAASSGDGAVVADWGFQDGVGHGAATRVRGASLALGAAAFGPERTLPRDTAQIVPYARRSLA